MALTAADTAKNFISDSKSSNGNRSVVSQMKLTFVRRTFIYFGRLAQC